VHRKDHTDIFPPSYLGALLATNAIAGALGPLSMNYIYERTKDTSRFGPGLMFLLASVLYFIGTIFVSMIPRRRSRPSVFISEEGLVDENSDDPLLVAFDSSSSESNNELLQEEGSDGIEASLLLQQPYEESPI
jgi:hypothetical protein